MKRVVMTGASGFVGANIARRLLRDGYEVHLLLRPDHRSWRIRDIEAHVSVHQAELSDLDALKAVMIRVRPDFVFHLAAFGAYSQQQDFSTIATTNIIGTANLLHASLESDFEAFIHAGSSSEYGYQKAATTEEQLPVPNSSYSWAKLSATLLCGLTARLHARRIHTLRLYSVYGPWEEPTRLVPTLISRGLQGMLPPLVNPDTARDFIYVEDVENAFLAVANQSGLQNDAVYNVCSGQETRLRDIVELTRQLLHIEREPDWGSMEQREWDTNYWLGDPSKLMSQTAWKPQTGLEEGFEKTIAWLCDPDHRGYYE